MTKSERLFSIINILKARRTAMTARELADRLDVSERTIYRDMQSLELSGVTINGEAGVGYYLPPQEHLSPLTFTEQEIEALMLGARLAKQWMPGDIASYTESALTKIRAVIPERLILQLNSRTTPYLVADYGQGELENYNNLTRAAIVEKRILDLEYKDAKGTATRRRIRPLGIIFLGPDCHLVRLV